MFRPLALTLVLLGLGLAMPAASDAMGRKPDAGPSATPSGAESTSPIADQEEAAGHVLTLGPRIALETTRGRIVIVTFPKEAPKAVAQVLHLVETGFYDGLAFHRVVPGFAAQVGDPATRNHPADDPTVGRGGSGNPLPAEFEGQTLKHLTGTAAMARGKSPASADSQFYLTLAPQPHLDGGYTIWGQVVSGQSVLGQLAKGDKIVKASVLAADAP